MSSPVAEYVQDLVESAADELTARAARLLASRIAGQSGLVTHAQAIEAGDSLHRITWRVSSGRWARMHPGVYLTTPGRDDWEMHAVAALLAVGSPCALTGTSAGKAWGLSTDTGWDCSEPADSEAPGHISVVVPYSRRGLSRAGILVRRSRTFERQVHEDAWPHRLTAEHTVFDLAQGGDPDRLISLMAKACQLKLATETSLSEALEARPRQPLRQLALEALGLVGAGAESSAELRYIRDVERAHGLPVGIRQQPAPGARHRDNAYPTYGVLVEIDGRLGHIGWLNQKRDSRRDRKAAAKGQLTIRGGWSDVTAARCEFAYDLAGVFRTRGWAGKPLWCADPACTLGRAAA